MSAQFTPALYPGAEQAATETLATWLNREGRAANHLVVGNKAYPGDNVLYSPLYSGLPELDYSLDSEKPAKDRPEHQEVLAAFQAAFAQDGLSVVDVRICSGYYIQVMFANPFAAGCGIPV